MPFTPSPSPPPERRVMKALLRRQRLRRRRYRLEFIDRALSGAIIMLCIISMVLPRVGAAVAMVFVVIATASKLQIDAHLRRLERLED